MLKPSIQQKLSHSFSPQQIQLMKLIQVPLAELEMHIKEELIENPALEEGDNNDDEFDNSAEDFEEDTRTESEKEVDLNELLPDDDGPYEGRDSYRNEEFDFIPQRERLTFHDLLYQQLPFIDVDEDERFYCETLLGYLDDNGYLRRDISAIVDDFAFTLGIYTDKDTLESALKKVQTLEPPGVGARTLQECLLLQLDRKNSDDSDVFVNAYLIVRDHFDSFTNKRYKKILSALEISEDELKFALEYINKLNPKPGNSSSEVHHRVQEVIPDFEVAFRDNELQLTLNTYGIPPVRVSNAYRKLAEESAVGKHDAETVGYVKNKLRSAESFIENLYNRHKTLENTMRAIMEKQHNFFMTGDKAQLNPMILKDIAEKVDRDISTISRVASSKYVQTDYGVFLLKSFFSESITNNDGEEISSQKVKKVLQDIIGAEDKRKPLGDEKLRDLLDQEGFNIARRTVAKYREQLNIPVARLRKAL